MAEPVRLLYCCCPKDQAPGLYYVQGKYDTAAPLQQRALAIREKALPPDHPRVATSLSNLANLYEDQGRHDEAGRLRARILPRPK